MELGFLGSRAHTYLPCHGPTPSRKNKNKSQKILRDYRCLWLTSPLLDGKGCANPIPSLGREMGSNTMNTK